MYIKFQFILSEKIPFLSPSACLVITNIIRHDFSILGMCFLLPFQSSSGQSVTNNRVSRCLARPRGAQKREAECWSSPHVAYPTRAPLFSRRSLGRSAHQLVAARKDTVCVCRSAIYLKGESPQSKDPLTHVKVILSTFIQAVGRAPPVCQTPALHWPFPIVPRFSKYLPIGQNLILTRKVLVMVNLDANLTGPWGAQIKRSFWVCVRLSPVQMSIWVSGLSKVHHPFPTWVSSGPLQAWKEQKSQSKGRSGPRLSLSWDIILLQPLDWHLHHWLPWFSGLQIQTRITSRAFPCL